MNTIVYDRREELLEWAANKIGIGAFRDDAQAIGFERNGELCAVTVFDNFSTHDCNIHIASDGSKRWLTRAFMAHCFSYPFITCNLPRVSGMVAEGNEAALKFDEHLGFKREGYHPKACATGAIISLGLMRSDCRYIPKEYQK